MQSLSIEVLPTYSMIASLSGRQHNILTKKIDLGKLKKMRGSAPKNEALHEPTLSRITQKILLLTK